MTEAELQEIEQRANAASPGPWKWWDIGENGGGEHDSLVFWNGGRGPLTSDRRWGLSEDGQSCGCGNSILEFTRGAPVPTAADGDFIAAARTDVPALVAEVRRLQACAEPDHHEPEQRIEGRARLWLLVQAVRLLPHRSRDAEYALEIAGRALNRPERERHFDSYDIDLAEGIDRCGSALEGAYQTSLADALERVFHEPPSATGR